MIYLRTDVVHLTWTPKNVTGWVYNDEWSNEFSADLGRALSISEMITYWVWCQNEIAGHVLSYDDVEGLTIALDTPFAGLPNQVLYPPEVVDQDSMLSDVRVLYTAISTNESSGLQSNELPADGSR